MDECRLSTHPRKSAALAQSIQELSIDFRTALGDTSELHKIAATMQEFGRAFEGANSCGGVGSSD